MTGLDCLKKEMAKRGCTKIQIESKVVAVVMDILAAEGTTKFTDFREIEKSLADRAHDLSVKEERLAARERRMADAEETLDLREQSIENMVNRKLEAIEHYVNTFQDGLKKCETAEGRDLMRRVQFYVNSVTIETPQNNTAYIEGLANILAGGKGDLGGMKKFTKTEGYPEHVRAEVNKQS